MVMLEETDQFQILREKGDALMAYTASLKEENERLVERLHIEEGKTSELMDEIEYFRASRVNFRQRVATLLEKIEQVDA
jgi:uncharacterized coiled-coil DUF342 family protein